VQTTHLELALDEDDVDLKFRKSHTVMNMATLDEAPDILWSSRARSKSATFADAQGLWFCI
jgi:hypothetical protein